jgi:RNA polymerase sigma factor (sigma-70 family)
MTRIGGRGNSDQTAVSLAKNRFATLSRFPLSCKTVKAIPGTLQDGGASFRTTNWGVIADCALADEKGSAALEHLCRDYWPPLYSFARRRGYSPSDAQDLVQGLFASFLKTKGYAQADRAKGKFRSFLLASLKHYMANVWDRDHAAKRGGDRGFVLLDSEVEAVEALHVSECETAALDEEQAYEERWANTLVACAIAHLSEEFSGEAKARLFEELKPFLCGGVGLPSQVEVAARLEIPIGTLRSHLLRLRMRYAELLRQEVARTIGSADDVDEELRRFRKILTE